MTVQSDEPLRLERRFAAPPGEVFDAWTNPEVLRRWWAAGEDWEGVSADVDLRVGGKIRLGMRNPDGVEYFGGGEYREIERPARLVYTWTWEGSPDSPSADSLVTVELEPDGDGATRLVLTHEGLRTEESRDQHAEGWSLCFDNLERRVLAAR